MRRQPTKVQTGRGKQFGIFLASSSIIVFIIIIGINMLQGRSSKAEFIAPPFDVNALAGEPSPENNFANSPVKAYENFKFMIDSVLYQQEDGSLYVHFTNPEDTEIWMMVEVVDAENNIIYKSGIVKNGQYIEKLEPIIDIRNEAINITINIYGYEPETYYSMGLVQLTTVLQPK